MSQPAVATPEQLVEDGLVTARWTAEFLHVSLTTVYVLMDSGHLPYVKIGRARRLPKRAVIEYAAGNLRGGWAAGTAKPAPLHQLAQQ